MRPFAEKVYRVVKKIPAGRALAYAEVARRAGFPRAARAVGQALRRNPHLVVIPCHRVVCSDGRIGGYARGAREKARLLRSEGVRIVRGRVLS